MKCPKCSTENGIYAYKCIKCGTDLTKSTTQSKSYSSHSGQKYRPRVSHSTPTVKQNKKPVNHKPQNVQNTPAPKTGNASAGFLIAILLLNSVTLFFPSYLSIFTLFCFYYGIKAMMAYKNVNENKFKKYYKKTKNLYAISLIWAFLFVAIKYTR